MAPIEKNFNSLFISRGFRREISKLYLKTPKKNRPPPGKYTKICDIGFWGF